MTVCTFEGCVKPKRYGPLCSGHYQQQRQSRPLAPLRERAPNLGAECSFQGCTRPSLCKGLCDGHYQQRRSGRDLAPLQVRHCVCTFEGCTNPHEARGLCQAHYTQFRVKGRTTPLTYAPSPVDLHGRVTLYGARDRSKGVAVGYASVDPADADLAGAHRWRLRSDGYATTKVAGKHVFLHRLFMPEVGPGEEVDHIDGDRLNNRRNNLRVVNHQEQAQNRGVRKDNKTGHRNVSFDPKKGLYRVCVKGTDGKRYGHRHKDLSRAIEEARTLRQLHMTHANEERSRR